MYETRKKVIFKHAIFVELDLDYDIHDNNSRTEGSVIKIPKEVIRFWIKEFQNFILKKMQKKIEFLYGEQLSSNVSNKHIFIKKKMISFITRKIFNSRFLILIIGSMVLS